jgi:hypothetical protein
MEHRFSYGRMEGTMDKWSGALVCAACLAVGACCGGDEGGDKTATDGGGGEATPSLEDQVAQSTPLSPSPGSATVGDLSLEAEVCAVEGAEFLGDSNMSMFASVAVADGRLFIADGSKEVRAFTIGDGDSCTLTLDADFGSGGAKTLGHDIEWLSVDGDGRVVASNGIFKAYAFDGTGDTEFDCDTKGYVEQHADGRWGISSWVNSTVRLVELAEGACSAEDWVLTDLSDDANRKGNFTSVHSAAVVGDKILIGGALAKTVDPETPNVVAVYDKAGKEKFRFGGSDEVGSDQNFGWVHAISGCEAGFCVLDSNYRRMTVWSPKGKFIGSVDLSELLDLGYPWINDFHLADDGYTYFVAANDRENSDVAEGVIYRVSGMGKASSGGAKATSSGSSGGHGKLNKPKRDPSQRGRPGSGSAGRGGGSSGGSSSGGSGRGSGGSGGRK